jgi:geranyl-CoA carboxylase alpha subunit
MTGMQAILIANRGEIAVRILRTVQGLGYRAVAVYSDADADAPHVRMADSACRIGPAPARDSYLNIGAILDAARSHGADAIHPGYGFLAENADFAQAVLDAGLTWIGPPPEAMRSMGNKAGAKRLLAGTDVPLLPGYQGQEQSDDALLREAARIGMPLMIKAAAGGGGRGMRLVNDENELASSLARARSEAEQAFGSGELILERALLAPRHVEVQVFADRHGNVVHLGERDCSVQRRHQKIIEEAPSPAVGAAVRAQLGAAAVQAARACGYIGAGTIEFLLDAGGAFWFMEMNTRLQVEHPVTEAITGLDLVEWQLRVAAGETLPLMQAQIDERLAGGGHAIEVRLCAEDPARDFLPQAGKITMWRAPRHGRTDHALDDGLDVSPYYDSMVAKLISHAATRDEARRTLARQLDDCVLLGIHSNQDFLIECLHHPEFAAGRATTSFIADHLPQALRQPGAPDWTSQTVAAGLLLACRTQGPQPYPDELRGWSSSAALESELEFELDGHRCALLVRADGAHRWCLRHGEQIAEVVIDECGGDRVRMCVNGDVCDTRHAMQDGAASFRQGRRNHLLRDLSYQPVRKNGTDASDGSVRAPMNGKVALLHAEPGQTIAAGQPLIVLEAMKMEHTLAAPCAGVLRALHVARGDQVAPGKLLAEIVPA